MHNSKKILCQRCKHLEGKSRDQPKILAGRDVYLRTHQLLWGKYMALYCQGVRYAQ